MGAARKSQKHSPEPSLTGRGKITGTAAAVEALRKRAEREAALRAQVEAEREERLGVQRRLGQVELTERQRRLAYVAIGVWMGHILPKDASVEMGFVRTQSGALAVISRDGLEWLKRKGTLEAAHYEAGLRFRADYELAHGTGVQSCLANEGPSGASFGPKSGPTDAMLRARGSVKAALKALGTPMLETYVESIAGEGRMLTDPTFVGDRPQRSAEHTLPCRIAFDMLARHYGMIR